MGMKQSMKLEYYTGEINSHVDYLKIIKMLEMKSEYIEYVLVDADDAKIIDYFQDFIVSVRSQKEWWGTKSS